MDKSKQKEFINLYNSLHDSLDRFCRVVAGNKEDGRDLLQDTVLATMEGFEKIRDRKALQAYMFSTASNISKRRFRYKKRIVGFDKAEFEYLGIDGQTEAQLDFKLVCDIIFSLPTKMSEAMILFHVNDMTLEEIQSIQGGSLSAVKLRLKRGRGKLKILLDEKQTSIAMTLLLLF